MRPLGIYFVERTDPVPDHRDYYDSFVVVAISPTKAKIIARLAAGHALVWPDSDDAVACRRIGDSIKRTPPGVISSSFNAA